MNQLSYDFPFDFFFPGSCQEVLPILREGLTLS